MRKNKMGGGVEKGNNDQGGFRGREGTKIVGREGWGKAPVDGESEGHYLKYGDGTSPRFIQRGSQVPHRCATCCPAGFCEQRKLQVKSKCLSSMLFPV